MSNDFQLLKSSFLEYVNQNLLYINDDSWREVTTRVYKILQESTQSLTALTQILMQSKKVLVGSHRHIKSSPQIKVMETSSILKKTLQSKELKPLKVKGPNQTIPLQPISEPAIQHSVVNSTPKRIGLSRILSRHSSPIKGEQVDSISLKLNSLKIDQLNKYIHGINDLARPLSSLRFQYPRKQSNNPSYPKLVKITSQSDQVNETFGKVAEQLDVTFDLGEVERKISVIEFKNDGNELLMEELNDLNRFARVESLLKMAITEFKRDHETLCFIRQVSSETKDSWFHDQPKSQEQTKKMKIDGAISNKELQNMQKNFALRKQIIYAKKDNNIEPISIPSQLFISCLD